MNEFKLVTEEQSLKYKEEFRKEIEYLIIENATYSMADAIID